jgi:hypothetical protein
MHNDFTFFKTQVALGTTGSLFLDKNLSNSAGHLFSPKKQRRALFLWEDDAERRLGER